MDMADDRVEVSGRRNGVAALAAVAASLVLGIAAAVPAGAGAPPVPAIDGPTGSVAPGDEVTVAITDCAELTGSIVHQFDDAVVPLPGPFEEQPDGRTWLWTFTAGEVDVDVRAGCGSTSLALYVNVDAPSIRRGPIDSSVVGSGVVLGTDCFEPHASLSITGGPGPIAASATPDEHGNWSHDLGTFVHDLTVVATCGDLTYSTLVAPGSGTEGTTTTAPPTAPGRPTPPAPPAAPQRAEATYTG